MTDAASRPAYLTRVDAEKLNRDTKALFDLEMGVTFSAYHAAARKTYEILKETGIPQRGNHLVPG